MSIFHNPSKIMKLMPFLLIMDGHLNSTKDATEGFSSQYKRHQAVFKAWFVCVVLKIFPKFPVDPYYEPLVWFMIHSHTADKRYTHIYVSCPKCSPISASRPMYWQAACFFYLGVWTLLDIRLAVMIVVASKN